MDGEEEDGNLRGIKNGMFRKPDRNSKKRNSRT